ncbi:MAG: AMP-binding protein [Pseudomonadota bacterium]
MTDGTLQIVRDETVYAAIARRRTSDSLAIVDGNDSFSYRALVKAVDALAGWLGDFAPRGQAVGIYMDNSIEAVVAILAVMRVGRTVVPINTKNDPRTVAFIADQAGIGAILTSARNAARLTDMPPDVKVSVLDRGDWHDGAGDGPTVSAEMPNPALIFFTSGSTGKPKGVCVSHGNLVHGADSVAQYLRVTEGLRMGAVLPLSFDAGLNWILTGLACGAEVHLLRYVFPMSLASDLGRLRIQALLAVPTVFFALSEVPAAQNTSGIRMASTGGRMHDATVRKLRGAYDRLEFTVMYGLTEAFRATYLPDALWADNPSSIGRPIPHADVHILDDEGQEAPVGQTGEIVQSGPLVSQGYANSPEQQMLRFGPTPSFSRFAETHPVSVYSGDEGYRDENGLLYFAGRKDRLIKSRGFRISPEEIEKEVAGKTSLESVVAFGEDDMRFGQKIIIVGEGVATGDITIETVRRALRGGVPEYMLPDELRWVDRFPINANGKIDVPKTIKMVAV